MEETSLQHQIKELVTGNRGYYNRIISEEQRKNQIVLRACLYIMENPCMVEGAYSDPILNKILREASMGNLDGKHLSAEEFDRIYSQLEKNFDEETRKRESEWKTRIKNNKPPIWPEANSTPWKIRNFY